MSSVDDATLDLGVVELAALLDSGRLTSLALTEGYLARIARRSDLNAFITVTADRARDDARAADVARASGKRGPLLGMPYALKDLVDTAGIATTWGTRALVGRVPEHDAEVAARLRAAGGVLLGKLSMTELANAYGNQVPLDNHGGPCRNPWNPTWWAGGSSSGSGAATAAGLCAFAIGSETWGSIDCPAAFCSVTGFRPTYDVVSRKGVMTLSYTLDKVGVFAREARDVHVVLDAIAQAPLSTRERTGPLRVGIVEFVGKAVGPEYFDAWSRMQAVIASLDVATEKLSIPSQDSRIGAGMTILFAERDAAFAEYIRAGHIRVMYDRQPWDEKVRENDAFGLRAADYVLASRLRAEVQREWQQRFERFDVVVCSGRADPPLPVDKAYADDDYCQSQAALQCEGNLAGLPAITIPMGFSAAGYPLSVHAVASPYDDRVLVDFAAQLQGKTDVHRRRPPAAPAQLPTSNR